MNNSKLYIIGNGFDLHHGIKSSYYDFQEYLEAVDKSLYELVETYLYPDEYWSDLEASFATLDIDAIVDYASNFLVSYGSDDWSDSYHHDYQYEIEQIALSLSSRLKSHFSDWISKLDIPKRSKIVERILNLDSNATFLSFNYTGTLEKLYNVKKSDILFIHGSVKNNGSEIVLGHAWDHRKYPLIEDVVGPEREDTRVLEGIEIIKSYFEQTFKQTDKIIETHSNFFKCLQNVTEISILGHSLTEVDINYFKEITKHIDLNTVKWTVSYYNDEELERHRNTMKNLRVKPEKINFIKLVDLIEREASQC